MGLRYLTEFGKLTGMKKIMQWVSSRKSKKRRVFGGSGEWMKGQIAQMNKMNQGIVSMTLGRD